MTENTPKGIYFDVKKKPFDIQIDNNKKELKLSKNVRYTDKQNFRRYKTLTEPKLLGRIMVDANDSQTFNVEEQIQRLLGLKPPQKKDERLPEGSDVFTAPSPYVEPPNPKAVRMAGKNEYIDNYVNNILDSAVFELDNEEQEPASGLLAFEDGTNAMNDVSKKDMEDLLGQIVDSAMEQSEATKERMKKQKEVEELAKRVLKSPAINLENEESINDLLRQMEEEERQLELFGSAKSDYQNRVVFSTPILGSRKDLFTNEPKAQKTLSRAWKANRARKELNFKQMQKAQAQDELGSVGSSVLSGASTTPSQTIVRRRGRPLGSVNASKGRSLDLTEPSIFE